MGASERFDPVTPGVLWPARPLIGPQPISRQEAAENTARAAAASAGSDVAAVQGGANVPIPSDTLTPKLFGEGGPSFLDLLDIINPLQHIPIVSNIYRRLTGDTIGHLPRIAGGALFGGPIGAGVALANVFISEVSGRDVGDHVIAFLTDERPGATETASVKEPPAQVSLPATTPAATVASAEAGAAVAMPTASLSMPRPPVPTASPPPEIIHAMRAGVPLGQPRPPEVANASHQRTSARRLTEPAVPASVARRQWAVEADAFASATPRNKRVAADRPERVAPRPGVGGAPPTPPGAGAVAAEGGWFSSVMLEALDKYENSARLAAAKEPAAVDVVN